VRLRSAIAAAAALLWLGCSSGLGEPCGEASPCPNRLMCATPPSDGGAAAQGVCDYPRGEEGDPCTAAAECESAFTCSNHFAPGSRYGTCTAKRLAGEACFADRDCTSGKCTGATGTTLDGTCAKPKP
jgi:hypothetical protein